MSYKFLLLTVLVNKAFSSTDPIVQLPNGQILGREDATFADTSYYAFEQIPYAAPPIGNLRFKSPQPLEDWTGILNTTTLDTTCMQEDGIPTSGSPSENCLFVNVYTPKLPGSDEDELIPVMFFIFGGGFSSGSSVDYPPDLFVDNGVILVTINYRLGIFGFLSTEDEVIPGNNGLKDQRLAIQWTHNNIKLFGGDPEKITIFGESAGAISVAYQILHQDNNGLFQNAILESGTVLVPGAYQRNPRNIAFGIAAILNSTFETNTNSQDLLEVLQSADAEDLAAAVVQYQSIASSPLGMILPVGLMWAPTIEVKNPDAIITRKMYGLLQAGNVLPIPTLMGFNSEEALIFSQDEDTLKMFLEAFDKNLDLVVPDDMLIVDADQHIEMGDAIRDIYTEGLPFADNLGTGIRCISDNILIRGIIKYGELFSKIAKTYFYQFSYDGPTGGISTHYDGAEGVGHTEELSYLFCSKTGCDVSVNSENDAITQQRLIKLWTNFAKYQNPTPEPSELLQNVTWTPVSIDDGDLLYLDINEDLEIKNHPRDATYGKWNDLYDSLGYSDFDTY